MAEFPLLTTERLALRAFEADDAEAVTELCNEWEIARTTLNIPHPYERWMAEAWIENHRPGFERGDSVIFAITFRPDGRLVGAVGLHLDPASHAGELGYWVGKDFWNQGIATEAARAVVAHAFDRMGLNRIAARHMTKNPASGRVMQKVGMTFEGVLRQSIFRWGSYEDSAIYSLLRSEFRPAAPQVVE